jgi:uncharacterized membrane protein YjjP (DUF1212 family)
MSRFYNDFIAIIGFALLCASVIAYAFVKFDIALTLFVGAIIFIIVGFYIIEFYKKQEEKPRETKLK